jgi:uncharacterized protein (DUF983 family)
MSAKRPAILIGRALRRRCPLCGQGKLFKSHFRMNRACPRCQVMFWKDSGESVGAMYVDYGVAAGAFLVAWALMAWFTDASDLVMLGVLAVVAVASVLVFHPWSRSFWTMLVYVSGGMQRPPMRLIPGGKRSGEPHRHHRRAAR